MALTPKDVDELHEEAEKLLKLWMNAKLAFVKAFTTSGSITADQESTYLQIKSEISRLYRTMSEKLPTGLLFDGDKMLEMLKNAMTMEHLQRAPAPDRQNYYGIWRRVYIKLTRTLGALEVMQQGYFPHLHRPLLVSKEAGKGKNK